MSALGRAIREGNWEWVAGWVCAVHGVELDAETIAALCAPWIERCEYWETFGNRQHGNGWSDGTWDMWLRNRIGHLWNKPGFASREDYHTTAVMHVFFWAIEETEEMVQRLRSKEHTPEAREARSKVFKTQLRPTPIDLTALLVAPPPN